MKATIYKTFRGPKGELVRNHPVFAIVRNTRSGPRFECLEDDYERAMARGEEIAEAAARDYGVGSVDVYEAELTIKGDPLRPEVKP